MSVGWHSSNRLWGHGPRTYLNYFELLFSYSKAIVTEALPASFGALPFFWTQPTPLLLTLVAERPAISFSSSAWGSCSENQGPDWESKDQCDMETTGWPALDHNGCQQNLPDLDIPLHVAWCHMDANRGHDNCTTALLLLEMESAMISIHGHDIFLCLEYFVLPE